MMISAIILSKNNDDTLEACLKSVLNSEPKNKEVIVVDAYSKDNTKRILHKYGNMIKIVHDEGVGLGYARNLGVKTAEANIIAFVDPDVICAHDHFQKILMYFNTHLEIGALSTPGIFPMIGTKIQKLESLFWKVSMKKQHSLRGWSIAFRRSAFDVVGGFCRGGSDDNDFTYKLKMNRIKIASIPINSWHIPRRTLSDLLKEMRLWAKNGAYLYYQWSSNAFFIHDQTERKLYRILHNTRVMVLIAYLSAPYSGIKYFRTTKNLELYLYFIVRQFAYALGYLQGNFNLAINKKLRVEYQKLAS